MCRVPRTHIAYTYYHYHHHISISNSQHNNNNPSKNAFSRRDGYFRGNCYIFLRHIHTHARPRRTPPQFAIGVRLILFIASSTNGSKNILPARAHTQRVRDFIHIMCEYNIGKICVQMFFEKFHCTSHFFFFFK